MLLFDNPWEQMERAQREMDAIYNRVRKARNRFPSVNLFDNDEAVQVEVIIPGIKKDELDISFENGVLTVKGERHSGINSESHTLVREERNSGEFSRSIDIPVQIDAGKIGAELSNGILTVTLPKAEEAKPKQIKIA